MLVSVLVLPEIDLLVSVSVVVLATNVSVAIGRVRTELPKAPVGGCRVIEPLVALFNTKLPTVDPAVPDVCAPDVAKLVPVAAPMLGVVRVGLVASTTLPEPVVAKLPKVPALL
jgi:hypothetical protein